MVFKKTLDFLEILDECFHAFLPKHQGKKVTKNCRTLTGYVVTIWELTWWVSRDRQIVYNWDGFTVCRDLNVDNYRYWNLWKLIFPTTTVSVYTSHSVDLRVSLAITTIERQDPGHCKPDPWHGAGLKPRMTTLQRTSFFFSSMEDTEKIIFPKPWEVLYVQFLGRVVPEFRTFLLILAHPLVEHYCCHP